MKLGRELGFVVYPSGALVAKGTEAKPIVLTSVAATPAAGDWSGLAFNGIGASVLDHVTIEAPPRSSVSDMASPSATDRVTPELHTASGKAVAVFGARLAVVA